MTIEQTKIEIKKLDDDTSSSIHSTFHLPDLQSIIQQLIENSLDAKATSINIQTKSKGFDEIVVRDNGSGIPKESRSKLCQLNYTSKLEISSEKNFLSEIKFYGFRGEALRCICDISESMTILTKTAEDDIGEELTFDSRGTLISSISKSCNLGTVVTVSKPFFRYPVRRKTFESKIQQQFKDSVDHIRKYAIICFHTRFQWTNIGSKNPILTKQVSKTGIKGSLAQFFGKNAIDELNEEVYRTSKNMFKELENDQSCHIITDNDEICLKMNLGIHAFFMHDPPKSESSKLAIGHFIFVNNRPVKHHQTLKKIKDYYTKNGIPRDSIAFVHFYIKNDSIDVNTTTDKSSVFFMHTDSIMEKFEKLIHHAIIEKKLKSIDRRTSLNSFHSDGGRANTSKTNIFIKSGQKDLNNYINIGDSSTTQKPYSEENNIPIILEKSNSNNQIDNNQNTTKRHLINHGENNICSSVNQENEILTGVSIPSQEKLIEDIQRWKSRDERIENLKRKRSDSENFPNKSPKLVSSNTTPNSQNISPSKNLQENSLSIVEDNKDKFIELQVSEEDIINSIDIQTKKYPIWYFPREIPLSSLDISQQNILDQQLKIIGCLPEDNFILLCFTPSNEEKHILCMDYIKSERILMEENMLSNWKMDKSIEEIKPIPISSIKEFQDRQLFDAITDPKYRNIILWNGFKIVQNEINNLTDNFVIIGRLQQNIIENFTPEVDLVEIAKKIDKFKNIYLKSFINRARINGSNIDEQTIIDNALDLMRPNSIKKYIESKVEYYAKKKMKEIDPLEAGEKVLKEMEDKQMLLAKLLGTKPCFIKLEKHFRLISSFIVKESQEFVNIKNETYQDFNI